MNEPLIAWIPADFAHALEAGSVQLVDVREPNEHDAERIDGAISFPLSGFNPSAVPHAPGKTTVFHCGIGKRSEAAARQCLAAGAATVHHLEGGLNAWKQAGLPTVQSEG